MHARKKVKKQTLQINIILEIFPDYLKQKNHPNNSCCFREHATDYEIRIFKNNFEFPILFVSSLNIVTFTYDIIIRRLMHDDCFIKKLVNLI